MFIGSALIMLTVLLLRTRFDKQKRRVSTEPTTQRKVKIVSKAEGLYMCGSSCGYFVVSDRNSCNVTVTVTTPTYSHTFSHQKSERNEDGEVTVKIKE